MGKLWVLVIMVGLVGVFHPAVAKTTFLGNDGLQADARRGFEEILGLWRDGRYGDVYERTIVGGKLSKEEFVGRLAAAPLRPACCWEQLQDVKVTVKGEGAVLMRAKLGFDGRGATTFRTRAFKLVKEEGVWQISQAEILSLTGTAKKGRSSKSRKKR